MPAAVDATPSTADVIRIAERSTNAAVTVALPGGRLTGLALIGLPPGFPISNVCVPAGTERLHGAVHNSSYLPTSERRNRLIPSGFTWMTDSGACTIANGRISPDSLRTAGASLSEVPARTGPVVVRGADTAAVFAG